MTFHKKNLETPKLMHKLIVFFVRHYKKMLYKKAQEYLGSKKLTMDEWLNSVSMNRRGDILCLFLLSIVTGQHACVHLRNGCMWSTLRSVPLNHDEHVSMCDLHLVYLGFGAFLCLVPRLALDIKEGDLPILGHVVGEDPETQNELTKKAIKEEKIDGPNEPNIATAAAGSAFQLPRVERELNMPPTTFLDSQSTSGVEHPQASEKLLAICKPLSVSLIRLCKWEIMKYQCTNIIVEPDLTSCVKPCKVKIWNLPLRHDHSVQLKQFNQSDQEEKLVLKKSTWKLTQTQWKHFVKQVKRRVHVFNVQRHILKRHHTKAYLKCRVQGCCMAYITFHSVRNATAHHLLHHPSVTYKCSMCTKIAPMPNSLRLHMYYHKDKQYKCNVCDQKFVYRSKLKQHKCMHTKLRMYECFHEGCNKKYRHPQDLIRHIQIHQEKIFECDFCGKKFAEKRLLKRHTVVHQNINPYTCEKCSKGFKHNNQLYRHRKKC